MRQDRWKETNICWHRWMESIRKMKNAVGIEQEFRSREAVLRQADYLMFLAIEMAEANPEKKYGPLP